MDKSTKIVICFLVLVIAVMTIVFLQIQGISILPLLTFPLFIVGGLLFFICSLVLAGAAFNKNISTGLLFLFVPFYNFIFAFTQYRAKHRMLVLSLWLGGMASVLFGLISIPFGIA